MVGGRADPKAGPCDTNIPHTLPPAHITSQYRQATERGRGSQWQPPGEFVQNSVQQNCLTLTTEREGDREQASSR